MERPGRFFWLKSSRQNLPYGRNLTTGRSIKQPRKGLERTDRRSFAAAFADGHCEIVDLSKTDDAKLRGLLTRAGGEDDD
jgi:hypothetical protein